MSDRPVSYKISVWSIEKYAGKRKTSYTVRWTVNGERFREPFGTRPAADSYRSALISAHRKGEPFDVKEGRPVSWLRESRTWFAFACEFVDMKWGGWAGWSRASAQEALTTATEALLSTDRGKPDTQRLREVLRDWAFSTRLQGDDCPEHLRTTLAWIERNTLDLTALTEPAVARRVLERISRTRAGDLASPHTAKRRRAIVNGVLNYACERRLLTNNPLRYIGWRPEQIGDMVDPASVINPRQAGRLLAEAGKLCGRAQRVYALFALMYYAGLRPEEALGLTVEDLTLPVSGWGEVTLRTSEPSPGTKWTKSRLSQETRQLKNRARSARRWVPLHPELVRILRWHMGKFAITTGRLFVGPQGGRITSSVYNTAFHRARDHAFTPDEAASPLARKPYDLRHACVSTWLASGVPAPQVAEWAGHSVAVLHRVYAKCLDGQTQDMLNRVEEAMDTMSKSAERRTDQGKVGDSAPKTSGRIRGEHPSTPAESGNQLDTDGR